jgi:hypothetical protein
MGEDQWAEEAREPGEEYTEEDFAALARFLFSRTDPLMLAWPIEDETDKAIQALNDVARVLLGQARAFRDWENHTGLVSVWDALVTIAAQWKDHADFDQAWALDDA